MEDSLKASVEDSLKASVEDSLKASVEDSLKSSMEDRYQLKWSKEQTSKFIKLRAENAHMFTGQKHSAALAWGTILFKMGLQGKVTPMQAKKKWDNLKRKYKHCRSDGSGDEVSKKPSAETWPWFTLMKEVLSDGGQSHVTSCPIVNGSEETPGTSSVVDQQNTDDPPVPDSRKRKRGREDILELLELIKENMRCQREVEDRRARESRDRMDTLFALLEKLIEKDA